MADQTNRLAKLLALMTFEPINFSIVIDMPTLLSILLLYSGIMYVLGTTGLIIMFVLTCLCWYTACGLQYFQKRFLIRFFIAKTKLVKKVSEAIDEYNQEVWGKDV